MKYGAAFKNLHKAFSNCFLIEKLRESSRLTELAKQIVKHNQKLLKSHQEKVCAVG